jgi:hypothetical protein
MVHVQFDALVGALPITEDGEEAQMKLIAKLQVLRNDASNIST